MKRFKITALVSALALALIPSTPLVFANEVSTLSNQTKSTGEYNEENQITPITANSGSTSFGDGATLTANAWIQPFSWSGCGQFKTSAVMNRSPRWIRNKTSFYQIGLGSLSIKGISIESSRAGENTLVWTNSNGAKGSYLSGSVCGGWGAVYLGIDVTGIALYHGMTRIASTHI